MGSDEEVDDPVGVAIARAFSALSSASTEEEVLRGVAGALGAPEQVKDESAAPQEEMSKTDTYWEEQHALAMKRHKILREKAQKYKFKLKPGPSTDSP